VGKKIFNFRLSNDPEEPWDIMWTDGMVTVDMLYKMKPYQRINHFPAMYNLSRKSNMCRNMMVLYNQWPKKYNFFSKTWLLPAQMGEFQAYYEKVQNLNLDFFIILEML
jgi:tubulin polyglutamylase TTLL6/13